MKRILNEEFPKSIYLKKKSLKFKKYSKYLFIFFIIFFCVFNDYIIISNISKYDKKIISLFKNNIILSNNTLIFKSDIDLNEEFFQITEVQKKLLNNRLSFDTLGGAGGNVGNALIILNNLINICINIKCKYIVTPAGRLNNIIKNPIFNKEFNITILPNTPENNANIDINLGFYSIFFFKYKNKSNFIRLKIIREEVLNNIPKYITKSDDLYINIRSGEIFENVINRYYSQPPLCFYKKIINENSYKNIFILANGHQNPVIDKLLKLYPKIKYIHGTVEDDMAVIIYAYNFVMSISTFPMTLIWFNNNLKNLYIYKLMDFDYFETINYNLKFVNYTIHAMEPSKEYYKKMNKNWKKTQEQLNLMMNEKCLKSKFIPF